MEILKECPECESKSIRLVKFKDGTHNYYCDKCDCFYIPASMMDENLRILKEKRTTIRK